MDAKLTCGVVWTLRWGGACRRSREKLADEEFEFCFGIFFLVQQFFFSIFQLRRVLVNIGG